MRLILHIIQIMPLMNRIMTTMERSMMHVMTISHHNGDNKGHDDER